ncbi:hypothetical protein [Enterococcus pallens]|uniref:Uncharacterized protein n=1 Tax=Enterococcus pallens ATCC BAA-351 TaxID=1158607 RepID=R2SDX4_9ENTE|nr:hypothetical protein [Enterococcus pallens]EOH86344.1 hypothetical protein UAU_05266 [Enterococcus pallens ATCC BAA-351]EOU09435.1 hypothetical protein I588_05168 [Enterococcus pallens ATCC BAA-351]
MRRTKKEFRDYNVYRDRPFGLKWATAYAMDDLMKQVRATEEYALKSNAALPRMSREDIDIVLSDSFLQTKEILVQLNLRDEYGRLQDSLVGFFLGEAYEDYFVFNDSKIDWEDVRHAKFTEAKKWSDIDIFEDARARAAPKKESDETEISAIKDEFYQPFPEELENDDNQGI